MAIEPTVRDELGAFIQGDGRLAHGREDTLQSFIATNREVLVLLARAVLHLNAALERLERPERS